MLNMHRRENIMKLLEFSNEIIFKILDYLSDQEIIRLWLKSTCYLLRIHTLEIIFKRTSQDAIEFQKAWLRYQLSHNTLITGLNQDINHASLIQSIYKHKNLSKSLPILILGIQSQLSHCEFDYETLDSLLLSSLDEDLFPDITLSVFCNAPRLVKENLFLRLYEYFQADDSSYNIEQSICLIAPLLDDLKKKKLITLVFDKIRYSRHFDAPLSPFVIRMLAKLTPELNQRSIQRMGSHGTLKFLIQTYISDQITRFAMLKLLQAIWPKFPPELETHLLDYLLGFFNEKNTDCKMVTFHIIPIIAPYISNRLHHKIIKNLLADYCLNHNDAIQSFRCLWPYLSDELHYKVLTHMFDSILFRLENSEDFTKRSSKIHFFVDLLARSRSSNRKIFIALLKNQFYGDQSKLISNLLFCFFFKSADALYLKRLKRVTLLNEMADAFFDANTVWLTDEVNILLETMGVLMLACYSKNISKKDASTLISNFQKVTVNSIVLFPVCLEVLTALLTTYPGFLTKRYSRTYQIIIDNIDINLDFLVGKASSNNDFKAQFHRLDGKLKEQIRNAAVESFLKIGPYSITSREDFIRLFGRIVFIAEDDIDKHRLKLFIGMLNLEQIQAVYQMLMEFVFRSRYFQCQGFHIVLKYIWPNLTKKQKISIESSIVTANQMKSRSIYYGGCYFMLSNNSKRDSEVRTECEYLITNIANSEIEYKKFFIKRLSKLATYADKKLFCQIIKFFSRTLCDNKYTVKIASMNALIRHWKRLSEHDRLRIYNIINRCLKVEKQWKFGLRSIIMLLSSPINMPVFHLQFESMLNSMFKLLIENIVYTNSITIEKYIVEILTLTNKREQNWFFRKLLDYEHREIIKNGPYLYFKLITNIFYKDLNYFDNILKNSQKIAQHKKLFELPQEIIRYCFSCLTIKEIINTWLQPICHQGRKIALAILFEDVSNEAEHYKQVWLRYNLMHNALQAEFNQGIEFSNLIGINLQQVRVTIQSKNLLLAAKAILEKYKYTDNEWDSLALSSLDQSLLHDVFLAVFCNIADHERATLFYMLLEHYKSLQYSDDAWYVLNTLFHVVNLCQQKERQVFTQFVINSVISKNNEPFPRSRAKKYHVITKTMYTLALDLDEQQISAYYDDGTLSKLYFRKYSSDLSQQVIAHFFSAIWTKLSSRIKFTYANGLLSLLTIKGYCNYELPFSIIKSISNSSNFSIYENVILPLLIKFRTANHPPYIPWKKLWYCLTKAEQIKLVNFLFDEGFLF